MVGDDKVLSTCLCRREIRPLRFIGHGVGKALFEHVLAKVCSIGGASVLTGSADPNAAAFYERMGAQRIGEAHAPRLNQAFPVLELKLGDALRASLGSR